MNIGDKISKAIKEGKWLNISYINQKGENTYYWIAVKDIDLDSHKLYVTAFNDKKSMKTFEYWIYFENIQQAEIIDLASYDVPDDLINKIEKNLSKCAWLNYDHFNHNVLNYYAECNILDNDPCQKEYTAIPGIDLIQLRKNKTYSLSDEQAKKIIADIYHYNLKNNSNSFYTLAINCFSIDEGKNKYVICYYAITFDPVKKALVLNNKLRFNQSFIVDGRRHSLFNYIKMDVEGAEMHILEGAVNTIKKFRPSLAIAIYHGGELFMEDFYKVPIFINEILENYDYYIRTFSPWGGETVLFCLPKK